MCVQNMGAAKLISQSALFYRHNYDRPICAWREYNVPN